MGCRREEHAGPRSWAIGSRVVLSRSCSRASAVSQSRPALPPRRASRGVVPHLGTSSRTGRTAPTGRALHRAAPSKRSRSRRSLARRVPRTAHGHVLFERKRCERSEVNALSIATASVTAFRGDAITLGAGGLTATTSASGSEPFPASLLLPITLSASQSWSIDGNNLGFGVELQPFANVTGDVGCARRRLSHQGRLAIRQQNVEAGPIRSPVPSTSDTGSAAPKIRPRRDRRFSETSPGKTALLTRPTATRSVSSTPSSLASPTARSVPSRSSIGGPPRSECAAANVSGANSPPQTAALPRPRNQVSVVHKSTTGTTAGTDYSQLSASGNSEPCERPTLVWRPHFEGSCPTLNPGDVETLVTTTGTLSGTFNGVPDETRYRSHAESAASAGQSPPTVKIKYTEHTVTATVESALACPAPYTISRPRLSQAPHSRARRSQRSTARGQTNRRATATSGNAATARATTATRSPARPRRLHAHRR